MRDFTAILAAAILLAGCKGRETVAPHQEIPQQPIVVAPLTAQDVSPPATDEQAPAALSLGMPVEHLAVSERNLFISVAGKMNTVIRWDLDRGKIESLLFPTVGEHTRSLTLSPEGRYLVVERGGIALLCHAETLQPVCDLGSLPEDFTPSAALAFSPGDLLLAHPMSDGWKIRDTATGEIVRSAPLVPGDLAGILDRQQLRVIQKNGKIRTIPISPIVPVTETAASPPLVRAQFLADGSLLALIDHGPHLPPELNTGLPENLLKHYPWTPLPSIWSGLLRNYPPQIPDLPTQSPLTSLARTDDGFITGEENGTVVFHLGNHPISPSPEALVPLAERLAMAEISSSPGPAVTLKDALMGEDAETLRAAVSAAENLPPLLQRVAFSRIAWLEGRKADALAVWQDGFPDLAQVRKREDWRGWEQADFAPVLDRLRADLNAELAAVTIPPDATPEQRQQVVARLMDAGTSAALGRKRLASACLTAALELARHKEESESTFRLANLARNLGAPPEPCLRAEAVSLTGMGDFKKAQPRWISLITDFPVANHEPGDYAEAAYTSYENKYPSQAMAILATGMHRYPEDANFALRAGWVSLLIGNAERAYEFLLSGQRLGFPAEKQENATALLAIAAKRTGADAAAASYFQDLLNLDTAWERLETLDALEWPESLKITLRQLAGM